MAQTTITKEFLPWLKVLNEYCGHDIVEEYNGFDTDRKRRLILEALAITVTTDYLILQCQFLLNTKDNTDEKLFFLDAEESDFVKITEKTLIKAIQSNGIIKIYAVDFKIITEKLALWGSNDSNQVGCKHKREFSQQWEKAREQISIRVFPNYAVNKKNQRIDADFNRLSRISLVDLKLFTTYKGKFVEGVLFTDPLVVADFITTFLVDKQGNHVQLKLCNKLSSHPMCKQATDESKFKQGTLIRIAEPFYEIFPSGKCGIEVDHTTQLQILADSFTDDTKSLDLNTLKEEGEKAFQDKNYIEALEFYLEALHYFPEICVLLNNRCQCEIKLGEYEVALLDAAAVLFLEESNLKGKKRYDFAVTSLGFQKHEWKELWRKVLSGSSQTSKGGILCSRN